MKTMTWKTLAAATLIAAAQGIAWPALAEDTAPKPGNAADAQQVDNNTVSALSQSGDNSGMFVVEQAAGTITGHTYLGATVLNIAGAQIGDVNDLVLSPDGRIEAVVIGVGGFLGMGEHNVAVPFDRIAIVGDPEGSAFNLQINATAEELAAAPEFETLAHKLAMQRAEQPVPKDNSVIQPLTPPPPKPEPQAQ